MGLSKMLQKTDAQDLADYKQAAEVLRDEVKRLRAALGTIRSFAYSEEPAEGLEEVQEDLRNIYQVAVKALTS